MASTMTGQVPLPFHMAAIAHPGRGYINAMMNFCRLLSDRGGFHISLIVTAEWRSNILSSDPPLPPCVQLCTIPNCIPSERVRAVDRNGFMDAVLTNMEEPFERLIIEKEKRESTPVQTIVGDTFLPWVVQVGNRRGIPVCSLFPMAACFFRALDNYHMLPVHVPTTTDSIRIAQFNDQPLEQYIPGLHPLRSSDLNTLHTLKQWKKILQYFPWVKKPQCVLFTTFYELESDTIDLIKQELSCHVYPIGPCVPYLQLTAGTNPDRDYYLTWLDEQPKKSVLYISLGSFLSVSQTQLEELASGLVTSQVKFLRVARDNSIWVQEIVGKYGLVVPWCEQLKVLCHPSIGGFLTHCGWNSTLEAVYAGIPMLTFPISSDQVANSRVIVEKWKVGVSLKGKRGNDEIVPKEEIAKVVKEFMDLNGDKSKELRKEALNLKAAAHNAIEVGGSSYNSLTNFIEGLSINFHS